MLTSRSFIASLLAALLIGGGMAVAESPTAGLVLGAALVVAAVCLLPRPQAPDDDSCRMMHVSSGAPRAADDVWWAVDWAESLARSDVNHRYGRARAVQPRRVGRAGGRSRRPKPGAPRVASVAHPVYPHLPGRSRYPTPGSVTIKRGRAAPSSSLRRR